MWPVVLCWYSLLYLCSQFMLSLDTYRVSQKKRSHVLNSCNSYKIGTRNKIRVRFEKFMKLSFQ